MRELAAYATIPKEALLEELGADSAHGLTAEEADRIRTHTGANELHDEGRSALAILLAQLRSPFVYLLVFASMLAAFLGQLLDAGLILGFIVLNACLGFVQEYRSEQTLRLLKSYVGARARVVRGGAPCTLPARELVPGDIVLLEIGDRVPADVRILEAEELMLDESTLTGESVPVEKRDTPSVAADGGPYRATNLAYAGTTVVRGSGRAVVLMTGAESSIGRIGMLHEHERRPSSYEQGIRAFSAFILRLVAATLMLVFVLHVFLNDGLTQVPQLLMFAIALAVGVIPEALPLVTTFTLSRGARMLARKHVVVRRLSAVEDLGSIEVLCTDKTGTITQNKLAVCDTWGDAGHVRYLAAVAAVHKSEGSEPFDLAVWEALPDEEVRGVESARPLVEAPFDPSKRFNALVVDESGRRRLVVRGALEALLARTDSLPVKERDAAAAWAVKAGSEGKRVLAVAERYLDEHEDAHAALSDLRHLNLGGLIAFADPVKPGARQALTHARALGLRVVILTGDSPEVAGAVAQRVGLTKEQSDVCTGEEFAALPLAEKHRVLAEHCVFARVTPEQKYEMIALLQERAQVGFLGEGINDVPALRRAGVSIVVNSASDISRDAADIILLNKSLEVIVEGIRAGRTAALNTSKYIQATLASSFGNFYAVAIVSLFVDFLPMLPIQILLLNLLTDVPMIAIALDTVDRAQVRKPGTRHVHDILLTATILGIVSTFFDFVFFALFHGFAPEVLQTNWFIGSTLTELAFLFSIRTHLPFWRGAKPPALILGLTSAAALSSLAVAYIPALASVFHFTAPTGAHLGIIFIVAVTYMTCSESAKLLYYRYLGGHIATHT